MPQKLIYKTYYMVLFKEIQGLYFQYVFKKRKNIGFNTDIHTNM